MFSEMILMKTLCLCFSQLLFNLLKSELLHWSSNSKLLLSTRTSSEPECIILNYAPNILICCLSCSLSSLYSYLYDNNILASACSKIMRNYVSLSYPLSFPNLQASCTLKHHPQWFTVNNSNNSSRWLMALTVRAM